MSDSSRKRPSRLSLLSAVFVIAVLLIALLAAPLAAAEDDRIAFHQLTRAGAELGEAAAAELEAALHEDSERLRGPPEAPGLLLPAPRRRRPRVRAEHALWVIGHRPASAAGARPTSSSAAPATPTNAPGRSGSSRSRPHAGDARVLGNRGPLLSRRRAATRARALRGGAEARAFESGVGRAARTARDDGDGGTTGTARREAAGRSLAHYESVLATAGEEQRRALLTRVAGVALEAGDHEKARSYAGELSTEPRKHAGSWNYGNAIHHGHLVLGRLALLDDNVEGAREHLLAAGRTPGSPQLNSFGPDMTLARELLDRGEREAVVAYSSSAANSGGTNGAVSKPGRPTSKRAASPTSGHGPSEAQSADTPKSRSALPPRRAPARRPRARGAAGRAGRRTSRSAPRRSRRRRCRRARARHQDGGPRRGRPPARPGRFRGRGRHRRFEGLLGGFDGRLVGPQKPMW